MKLTYRVEPMSNARIMLDAVRLVQKHIREEGLPDVPEHELAEYLMCLRDIRDGAVFVAYDECDVLAGVIVAEWNTEGVVPFYEVKNLWVEPADRGNGVAKLLMKALIDWSGEEDAPVYICTFGEPRGAYKRMGFEVSHVVSRASLKELRKRVGGEDGKRTSPDPGGSGSPGADECGQEFAAAGGAV